MKYCSSCQKLVNINRMAANMGFAEIWNDNCESCGTFIDSGFEHTNDLIFDMNSGKVSIKKKGKAYDKTIRKDIKTQILLLCVSIELIGALFIIAISFSLKKSANLFNLSSALTFIFNFVFLMEYI